MNNAIKKVSGKLLLSGEPKMVKKGLRRITVTRFLGWVAPNRRIDPPLGRAAASRLRHSKRPTARWRIYIYVYMYVYIYIYIFEWIVDWNGVGEIRVSLFSIFSIFGICGISSIFYF